LEEVIANGPLAVAVFKQLEQSTAPLAYESGELKVVVAAQIGFPLVKERINPSVEEDIFARVATPEA